LDYYKKDAPKSLGKEWVEEYVKPIIQKYKAAEKDILRTLIVHISLQIAHDLQSIKGDILFSGGGVFNKFLMETIQSKIENRIDSPSQKIIDFKEALIFAFLGLLRYRQEINVLASVTGASKDHSSGKIIS